MLLADELQGLLSEIDAEADLEAFTQIAASSVHRCEQGCTLRVGSFSFVVSGLQDVQLACHSVVHDCAWGCAVESQSKLLAKGCSLLTNPLVRP